MQNDILSLLKSDKLQKLRFGQLPGLGMAHLIHQIAQQLDKFLVLITPDNLTSQRLEREILFFQNNKNQFPVIHFPDRETLPYDIFSPQQDIISERLKTLSILPMLKRGILLVNIATLLQFIPPKQYIQQFSLVLKNGDRIHLDNFKKNLVEAGYLHVSQVMEPGEFCLRGSLIDLFPSGSKQPFRIELFDDEIDSLRTFDVETQRTVEKVSEIELLPAREHPLTEDGISYFRQQWRSTFSGNPLQSPIYQAISDGQTISGIEYYLPLFFENMNTLLDYLPKNSVILKTENMAEAGEQYWQEINSRHEQRAYDYTRPLLSPDLLFLKPEKFNQQLQDFSSIQLSKNNIDNKASHFNFDYEAIPDINIERQAEQPLRKLNHLLNQHRVLICAETAGRRESLLKLLTDFANQPVLVNDFAEFLEKNITFGITTADIEESVFLKNDNIYIISEAQIFGLQVLQIRKKPKSKTIESETAVRDLLELTIGAPIVHLHHGIGLYQGLQKITVGQLEAEYVTMEYHNGDKLYVPVSSLHLISRYSGPDADRINLNKLGTETWHKTKQKAAEKIKDVAAELLLLQAQRNQKPGYIYQVDETEYARFASEFPFELTIDQDKAITDIYGDMSNGKTMDRLVCGDVGFGKTEVAMRAAFFSAMNNKQVVVLVPTTLLAQQHYQNFSDRFANWPIQIEVLSRFQSDKNQKLIIEKLKSRRCDIVIGTHKLLQNDLEFSDLGLLIIDEEHRFGVQQKEKIKKFRHQIDILTLTATPIPRTLNMSMSGIRDLSLITTPPARRLMIKTFVHTYENELIREAILREISRGGQVYFLHNDVATIRNCADEITKLLPEIKLGIAHGQMPERELERVMADFYHHRFNVLVCSTIIESGIDIPSANTIIIERADKLGLAQLHQLRGRVGRSHHQAYAYLLVAPDKKLTKDAEKRLDAISQTEDLGAGFMLASHDLEIRGAGELLGEEQSGQMEAIGFTLYMELLERAVKSLKKGIKLDNLESNSVCEIEAKIPSLFPENYMPDVHQRLIFYKRLANAGSQNELDELQVELIDRFGLLPEASKNLFRLTEVKLIAESLGIKKIDAGMKEAVVLFHEKPNVDPDKIILLIQTQPNVFKFDGPNKLRVVLNANAETLVDKLENTLNLLKA